MLVKILLCLDKHGSIILDMTLPIISFTSNRCNNQSSFLPLIRGAWGAASRAAFERFFLTDLIYFSHQF